MNINEIFDNLRYHHENEVVEFKKAENSFDFDDLGKYFSALSNEANLRDKGFGWLVFGVQDKTREILGTSYKNGLKSLQKLKHDIAQHITDNNTFRDIFELTIEGKRVLLFQIPAAPRGIPIAWQGHFYARRGESLVALDMNKYDEIRRQTVNVDWSKQIVLGATVADLDDEAIAEARKGFKEHYPRLKNLYPTLSELIPDLSEESLNGIGGQVSGTTNSYYNKGIIKDVDLHSSKAYDIDDVEVECQSLTITLFTSTTRWLMPSSSSRCQKTLREIKAR